MDEGNVTVRCALLDLPHHEHAKASREHSLRRYTPGACEGDPDTLKRQRRLENVEWTISREYWQGCLRVAHPGQGSRLHLASELALPLLGATVLSSR
jgi:hypothetical protein